MSNLRGRVATLERALPTISNGDCKCSPPCIARLRVSGDPDTNDGTSTRRCPRCHGWARTLDITLVEVSSPADRQEGATHR
jgi:hypothetical protein